MAGGNRRPPGEGLGPLLEDLRDIRRRLRELEKPTGTSLTGLLARVEAALEDLETQVAAEISAQSYTRSQIDSKVASPGNISPGNVDAAGWIRTAGALRAQSVYSTILSSDYRAVWVTGVDGQLGHVPSSRQFKQDIQAALIDPAVVLALRLVTFRYIEAVTNRGEQAAVEVGLIAEEVHELGLHWLVDYDEDGNPFGVKFERLAFGLLSVAQDHENRIAALEALTEGPPA